MPLHILTKLRKKFGRDLICIRKPKVLKIILLGSDNCGKTSILRRYAGDLFYEEKQDPLVNTFSTTTFLEVSNKIKELETEITEVSRQESKLSSSISKHCESANAFILVYSADDQNSLNELRSMLLYIHKYKKPYQTVVMVRNKSDLDISSIQDNNDCSTTSNVHQVVDTTSKRKSSIKPEEETNTSKETISCKDIEFKENGGDENNSK